MIWDPRWIDRLPAPTSSEAEDPGYKIDPKKIVDLLPRLPKVEQRIVDMVLFQGLSHAAAGEELGVSQPAVSARLQHAYALLRHWAALPELGTRRQVRAEIMASVRKQEKEWRRQRPSPSRYRRPDVAFYVKVIFSLAGGATRVETAAALGRTLDALDGVCKRVPIYAPRLAPFVRRPPWPTSKAQYQRRLRREQAKQAQ